MRGASLPPAGIVIEIGKKKYSDVVARITDTLYLTISTDVPGENFGNCEL